MTNPLHLLYADLWLKAAQWESSDEGNSNHELAREILLKGQRVNPESEALFLEVGCFIIVTAHGGSC